MVDTHLCAIAGIWNWLIIIEGVAQVLEFSVGNVLDKPPLYLEPCMQAVKAGTLQRHRQQLGLHEQRQETLPPSAQECPLFQHQRAAEPRHKSSQSGLH